MFGGVAWAIASAAIVASFEARGGTDNRRVSSNRMILEAAGPQWFPWRATCQLVLPDMLGSVHQPRTMKLTGLRQNLRSGHIVTKLLVS